MNRYLLGFLVALLCAVPMAAGPMKASLDLAVDSRLLDNHFASYGYAPPKSVFREPQGVRFYLPAGVKGVVQTGMYSYFALAGDFEIAATFELLWTPAPKEGYGVSCGIAVDTDGPDGFASLARGIQVGKGNGFLVTRGKPGESGPKDNHFPTEAKSGRLVLRRERAELICLVADNLRDEVRELSRIPFTRATIRKVRLFADAGGSPTVVDVRLGNVVVRAEEITGGIPLRDQGGAIAFWLTILLLVGVAAGAAVIIRRRWQTEEDDD